MLPAFTCVSPVLQIALDVAKGLVFLHSRRIVHFDVSACLPAHPRALPACLPACLPCPPARPPARPPACLPGRAPGGVQCSTYNTEVGDVFKLVTPRSPPHPPPSLPQLKSPNILLSRDGTAKIADVGMARILQRDYVTGVISTLAW